MVDEFDLLFRCLWLFQFFVTHTLLLLDPISNLFDIPVCTLVWNELVILMLSNPAPLSNSLLSIFTFLARQHVHQLVFDVTTLLQHQRELFHSIISGIWSHYFEIDIAPTINFSCRQWWLFVYFLTPLNVILLRKHLLH